MFSVFVAFVRSNAPAHLALDELRQRLADLLLVGFLDEVRLLRFSLFFL